MNKLLKLLGALFMAVLFMAAAGQGITTWTAITSLADGDFIPLVHHLSKAMGCKVEVIAFEKSASTKLKEAADLFVDLDVTPGKYLMKDRKK